MEHCEWISGQMGWHERVHVRLGENLYYFFIKLSPLDMVRVQRELDRVIGKHQFGSVRAFAIFGAYDLIVRAWIHSNIVGQFRIALQGALKDHLRTMHIFEVITTDYRWYKPADPKVLAKVDDNTIRGAQQRGVNLPKLIDAGIVTYRHKSRTDSPLIRFFTSVYLEHPPANDEFVTELVDELKANIEYMTVDRGFGFCSFVLKGESSDYFAIAKVPALIARQFRNNKVTTETFLCWGSTLTGGELIGDATFKAMEKKDLFIYSLLPEYYNDDPYNKIRKNELLEFFATLHSMTENGLTLTDADEGLLHDSLYGYLKDNPTETAKALFGLFADTERYLRKTYRELLGRQNIQLRHILDRASVVLDAKKHLVLGDLLTILYQAGSIIGDNRLQWSEGSEFAHFRNTLMHGGFDSVSLQDLATLVRYLPNLRQLLEAIGEMTQEAYQGS